MMPAYQPIKKLYESSSTEVWRALSSDSRSVVLKKSKLPSDAKSRKIRHEAEILSDLYHDNIVKFIELEERDSGPILVLEDFDGVPFSDYLSGRDLNVAEFLKLAIKITRALEAVHSAGIIHKDMNPGNFIYNRESDSLKLIDINNATLASQEKPLFDNVGRLTGSLSYISPEQTGRPGIGPNRTSNSKKPLRQG